MNITRQQHLRRRMNIWIQRAEKKRTTTRETRALKTQHQVNREKRREWVRASKWTNLQLYFRKSNKSPRKLCDFVSDVFVLWCRRRCTVFASLTTEYWLYVSISFSPMPFRSESRMVRSENGSEQEAMTTKKEKTNPRQRQRAGKSERNVCFSFLPVCIFF